MEPAIHDGGEGSQQIRFIGQEPKIGDIFLGKFKNRNTFVVDL